MTIDEAIKHCLSIAEKGKECAGTELYECGKDFQQLAEWLTELEELRDKHWDECRQIAHYDDELTEAKRLLKAAVEDMSEENFCAKVCKRDNFACRVSDTCDFKWRYADEAEKLLKEADNG